jgi:TPR repeat protein
MLNNAGLQGVVGNAASLLDTKKTLDMYRANVKKTNDAAVQYEFAIFMINAAQNGQPEDDVNAAQLMSEAKHILQRLSDRAYPFAQYYLGDGYFSGVFNKNKPDYDKAFPLFVAASKHGHAEAGYRAALCYEFGWGTSKSYPKAVQFYRNSASKNHPGAATRLGMACLKGDMGLGKSAQRSREGMTWLKRATESADFQYNSAPYEIGLLHLNGYGDDVFKDEGYAAQLITQAAELGHVKANFLMGQAYENGLYGCPRDAALSVHFYNGAASLGMPEAMMALCAWYMVGAEPVLEKDENEACAWAMQAAELGTFSCTQELQFKLLSKGQITDFFLSHRHAESRICRRLLHRDGRRLPSRPAGSQRLVRSRGRERQRERQTAAETHPRRRRWQHCSFRS